MSTLLGRKQAPEHVRKRAMARRRERRVNGHFLAENRVFDGKGEAHGCRACKREWGRQHAEERAAKDRRWRYRITAEHYEALLKQQDMGCAICGRLAETQRKRLAVDHDHTSGRIRGLLCDSCNRGIGLLGDSPELLLDAVAYLRREV